MAIVTAEKIFVDVDDEINFVVEKLLSTENSRVILISPQNAVILSSLVSLKILLKQMLKSKKLMILVTEDAFGQRIAETAGLIVAKKVSEITSQMWEVAAARKESLLAAAEQKKIELLAQRGIATKKPESAIDQDAEKVIENKKPLSEQKENAIEHSSTIKDESVVESAAEVKGAIQRPRPQPKMVTLGSLQIMAGGDITNLDHKNNTDMTPSAASRDLDPLGGKPKNGFTGRDWTKYKLQRPKGLLAKLPFGVKKNFRSEKEINKAKKRRRIILFSFISILFLFLAGTYFVLFNFSSVDLVVTLESTDIPIEQTINISADIEEFDPETITVPAIIIPDAEQAQVSASASAKATGEGVRGDKATGMIEIWNKTDKEIKLKKGTEVATIGEDLKYVLDEAVTIEPAEANEQDDEDSLSDYGGLGKEWSIVASEVGAEFNLSASQTIEFSVEGYSTKDLIGKGFKDIEGGNSEIFQAVSENDFKQLRNKLRKQLLEQGSAELQAPDGYRLIEGTEKFEQTEAYANPEIGEETEEVTVTVEGEISALAVGESDLQQAIEILITNSQSGEGENDFQVTGLENAVFSEVKRTDGAASFKVSSQGSLQTLITEDQIKQRIMGKSVEDAKEYLANNPAFSNYSLVYSPGFVPENWRRIPSDPGRISLRIK